MSPISRFVTHFWDSCIWKILHYDGKKRGKDKDGIIAEDIGGLL
jgi:hypothetical protein